MTDRPNNSEARGWLAAGVALILGWIVIAYAVNPVGEFMVNDDWAYVRALESLRETGRLGPTGWGPGGAPGGPALLTHLLWGLLVTETVGFSLTALRISMVFMGLVGCAGLLLTLRLLGLTPGWALWAVLTVMTTPLFLSQCFTFMTDTTFTVMAIWSILFLTHGIRENRTVIVGIGLGFALAAVLTRQLGLVIPLAFTIACFGGEEGGRFGRFKAVILSAVVVVIPWLIYEIALQRAGSTPIVAHQLIAGLAERIFEKGLPDYLFVTLTEFFGWGLGYTTFFVTPLLASAAPRLWRRATWRRYAIALSAVFLVVEAALLGGFLDLPTAFHRNVIYDFGVGPVLLKDAYILDIQRFPRLPPVLWYALVYWTALWAPVLAVWIVRSLRASGGKGNPKEVLGTGDGTFAGRLSALCAVIYLAVISLTGYHDRYLAPVIVFVIIHLAADRRDLLTRGRLGLARVAAAGIPFILIASFSLGGLHDFMALKRGIAAAHEYLLDDLGAKPCEIDGGFEFNGYHCYRNDFAPREGLSWWWAPEETYLVALGPLPGYRVVRVFPFDRTMGGADAVYVLTRLGDAAGG